MKRPALEAAGRLKALRRRAAPGGGQGVTRWQHTPAASVAGGGLAARVIALQRSLGNQRIMGLLRSPKAQAVEPVAGPQATIQRQGGGVVNLTLGPVRHRTYELSAATLEGALNELSARGEWGSGGAENIQYEYSPNS
ncbi:MAG TPA: hypothetical protein VNN21_02415, partial [Dehalococcoidia bacterium]|nr:hypothetical protein [Dehalococcoidia bacterium]